MEWCNYRQNCVLAADGCFFSSARNFWEMQVNIYVGNLPYGVTEDDLRELFGEYGDVDKANIIIDRMTNQSKGFGFVEMPNSGEAEAAINALNGSSVKGRDIKVNQARPRPDRPPRRDY